MSALMMGGLSREEAIRQAIERCRPRGPVEIEVENIGDYAVAEPDWISLGALTHSAEVLDMSLELCASPTP